MPAPISQTASANRRLPVEEFQSLQTKYETSRHLRLLTGQDAGITGDHPRARVDRLIVRGAAG